jgi:hypothetical protein
MGLDNLDKAAIIFAVVQRAREQRFRVAPDGGVRSSCETLATKSRRMRSRRSSPVMS